MPKKTARRIIDSRTGNRSTTISGVTLSAPAPGVTDHGVLLGLADDDHTQYLLADGTRSLSGNLSVDASVTIDGVDISAHAANASAHHAPVTAGTLIGLSGQQVSVATGANYQFVGTGSGTAAAWQNLSTLAGNGLTHSAGVLAVGAGDGLTVAADAIALTTPGTLTASTTNSASGNHTHAVTTGAASTLSVSTANATGSSASLARADHLHTITTSSNPGAAASILATDASGYLTLVRLTTTDRMRTPLLDTASGNLTVQPAGDVMLDPAGGEVRLAANRALQSDNYASQTTGMRVTYAGEGDFRYLFTDELHAKSFIVDLEQALAGGQIIGKSVAVVAEAFVTPAAGGAGTLRVRDLPSAANMAAFVSGDIVRLRTFSRAAGSLTIADCWGVVTAYADGTGANEGTQTWTFTRSSAPNAGAMAAGTVIAADSLALDYGTTGNGFYEVSAIDGAYGLNSPYAQIVSWATHPATGQTVRSRLGNLRGIFGTANEYGLYAGAGTATSDAYLRISNTEVGLYNLPLRMYTGGTERVHIAAHNDVWIGPSSADKRLSWDGSTLTVSGAINVTGGNAATLGNVTGASNLVLNASFESDSNADGLADGFVIYNNDGGAVPTVASRVAGEKSTWAQRISWTGTNASTKGIYFASTTTKRANVDYVLTFWARTNTAVNLGFYENAPFSTQTPLVWQQANTIWQFYAVRLRWSSTPAAHFYLSIEYAAAIANGWIEFDNVQVVEGSEIVPWALAPSDKANTSLDNSVISTLISGANIRVGSGVKDSTLNGWNIDATEIVGQAAGIDQVVMDTSGAITAGAGTAAINRYGYLIADVDISGGATWPFVYGGLHSVANVGSPTTNYRGSLMFGTPLGVYANLPNVWFLRYPGTLPVYTPVGGGASLSNALMLSDDSGYGPWVFWHSGNDGSGSGLDADTLDSYQASQFALLAGATFSGALISTSTVGYDWSALTPATGWQNTGGSNATLGVKRFGNMVSLKGMVSANASLSSGSTVYTLATEYRPSATRVFNCRAYIGSTVTTVQVNLQSDGQIRPQSAFSSGDWVSLEIMYFTGG